MVTVASMVDYVTVLQLGSSASKSSYNLGLNNILFCLNIHIIHKHSILLNGLDSKLQKLLCILSTILEANAKPVCLSVSFLLYP